MKRLPLFLVMIAFLVSATGCTSSLHYSIQQGNPDKASRLIVQGADVNEADFVGFTPLMYAAINNYPDIANTLLDHGADANKGSSLHGTPLMLAAGRGYAQVVALLLERGANVDAKNAMGQTALERAAYEGHAPIVKMLLDKGADADVAITNLKGPLGTRTGERTDRSVALIKSFLTAEQIMPPASPQGTNQPTYSQDAKPQTYPGGVKQMPYSF